MCVGSAWRGQYGMSCHRWRSSLHLRAAEEYRGTKYYWLAEWKLEVTLPTDVAPQDRFEVLFGSKGPQNAQWATSTDGHRGTLADVRRQPFEWIALPLGTLTGGKSVTSRVRVDRRLRSLPACASWASRRPN